MRAMYVKILIPFFIFGTRFSLSQWETDIRLTNDPSDSWNPKSTVLGSVVHAVWWDNRDGNTEIYYKQSTDNGTTWKPDIRITNNPAMSFTPCISAIGQIIHIVWEDNRDGNDEIYYNHSTDAGISWGSDIRLTNFTSPSRSPIVIASGLFVHVVWEDGRNGSYEIYYKQSTDEGLNWGSDVRLTNYSGHSLSPSISVVDSNLFVSWHDNREGNAEIFFKRSTNRGTSWQSDIRLTSNSSVSNEPDISKSGNTVHVVWQDDRDGNYEVYYKQSTNEGTNWGNDIRLTNASGNSWFPIISTSGSNVHVVWRDDRDGNSEIYYKFSSDGGSSWKSDSRLTINSAESWTPTVSVTSQVVHIIWHDGRDGNSEIYYKRNPTGNPLGIINIGSEIPGKFSLSQNYPNPFNPLTKIRFDISGASVAQTFLSVYDILGREIETLLNEQLKPGTYEVDWDASALSSGIYIYKIETDGFTDMKKMILIK